jgi:hypothetical protein
VTAANADGETAMWRIPENLWILLRMKEGTALTDIPAYVAEASAEGRWTVERSAEPFAEKSAFRRFSYGQMLHLCDRLRSDFAVDEDTWRRIDRLEEYAARHTEFSIGNKLYEAKTYLEMPEMFAWTAVVVLLSILLEQLLLRLTKRLTPAYRKEGAHADTE